MVRVDTGLRAGDVGGADARRVRLRKPLRRSR